MIAVNGAWRRERRRRSRRLNAGMSLTKVGRALSLVEVASGILGERRLPVICLLVCIPANIFALRS
jgi:hypothetical protein